TFSMYREALKKVFSAEELSFFGADMTASEIELNAYRFQNDSCCRIMLCDSTGGEGRNFQCADYIIHIDLPWDANIIEQRIGRLDRLERDKARPVVHSVVVYTENTFENALFNFWNKGLKIFTQSLSGMEIIMKDINQEIISSIRNDFKYGLFERIPEIIKLANEMRETIRKEQNYDAASFIFRPMYAELKRLTDYYARNENDLFADTMNNWASLAGFRGFSSETGILTYTAASFSPKSAINSQLIPPSWNDYLNTEQNRFLNGVQERYNKSISIQNQDRSIRGTFVRKIAIENDYLHFFAPGDEIFDCIVNNALHSCKGRASAFAVASDINWKGLIFTWSLEPNESILLDHGISIYALGPYRNYLLSEQVVIPVSIENEESYKDEQIIYEYHRIINSGFKREKTVHLGKRTQEAKYLGDFIRDRNIDWFKEQYPEESWIEFIDTSRKDAYKKAFEQFKRRSNVRSAKDEMERILSARVANSEFYDISDDQITNIKKEQKLILEAIQHPKLILDSAAFVWMVKN
ncbi:MAG: helicase-related protein, partial [Eubacteriaceae bacterium]